jgi:hypothetical protein
MKGQGYVSALLALLKFDPDQPRVPAGSGRESGEWTAGDGGGTAISAPPATAGLASLPPAPTASNGFGFCRQMRDNFRPFAVRPKQIRIPGPGFQIG